MSQNESKAIDYESDDFSGRKWSNVFSYGTLVMMAKKGEKIVLDTNFWNYSRTTVKYLCQALYIDGGINEIRKAIKEGRYILEDLQMSEYEIIKKA